MHDGDTRLPNESVTRLRIFSDRQFLLPGRGHVVMLAPFWGKNPEDPNDPSSGRFDRYAATGADLFEMTSLPSAEIAVLPMPWEHVIESPERRAAADRFLGLVQGTGKRTIIFFCSDSEEDVPVEAAVVFRSSFRRSTRKSQEFALPAWSEDLVKRYGGGSLPVRPWNPRPSVGFCGFAPGLGPLSARSVLGRIRRRLRGDPGSVRARALRALRSPNLELHLVLRDRFWAGLADPRQARREFAENLLGSDYALCARGGGNFSYRLYEALSCGRIPVFVDTDCVLPFDRDIPWRELCVWVDEAEIDRIAECVLSAHARQTPEAFAERQRECRRIWETWLSPEGFFANLRRCL
jgi:hypothetical protein